MNLQDFRQLSAGHALHALSVDEELAFAQALTAHPEWQSIVDADLETAAELGDAVPNATPSASVRGSLLDLIGTTPQVAAVGSSIPEALTAPPSESLRTPELHETTAKARPARSGRRRALWAGAFALAASLAVLATVTLGPQLFSSNGDTDPAVIALAEVSQASDAQAETVDVPGGGQATLHWSRDLDRAVLVAEDMPELPGDEDFEVWFVRGETPISAGIMESTTEPAVLAGFQPGDVVALTIEAAGGSPSGLPTTDPIVAIATA